MRRKEKKRKKREGIPKMPSLHSKEKRRHKSKKVELIPKLEKKKKVIVFNFKFSTTPGKVCGYTEVASSWRMAE